MIPVDLSLGLPAREEVGLAEPAGPVRVRPATVVIAEGLLMYLEEERVIELLRWVRGSGDERTRFIFSFMATAKTAPGAQRSAGLEHMGRAMKWWLKRVGEPMRWSLARGEVEAFARSCGWSLRERFCPSGEGAALTEEVVEVESGGSGDVQSTD